MKNNTPTNFITYFAMKTFALFLILLTSSFLRAQSDPTLQMDMVWVSSTTNTADFQVRITNTSSVPFTFNSVIIRGVHAASLTTGTVSWVALNDNTIPTWLGWPNVTTNLPYTVGTRKLNYSSNGTFFTAGTAPTIPIPAGTGVIIGTFRVSTTTTWTPNSNFSFVWEVTAAVVGYINGATTSSSIGQPGGTAPIPNLTVSAPVAQPLNSQAVPPPSSSVLTGTATICSGSSTNLSVAVTGGVSPYTVTVTDGTNNYFTTSASPVSIPVSPSSTSTYSIVSVTGGGTGTGNTGSATVTVNQAPAATISYSGSPWCSSSAVQSVSQTGTTGGTYSSTAGLSINTSTGAITPGTSTAGTYTVSYTIAAAGGCAALSVTTSVTITAAQSATIAYASSTICAASTTVQSVIQTGTTGGTFSSSPSGLSISTTGAITPNTSTIGTYTVTYTLAASGVCPGVFATTTISISSTLAATISYAGSPFCKTLSTAQSVSQTGAIGGAYSSTTGLSINASTGAITPSTSTAGTYTVTYTVTAAGCSAVSTTASVTISPIPSGTISYTGSPFCRNNTTNPTITRSTVPSSTGTYTISPTSGLSISSSNGGLAQPSVSSAGVYTVTLTLTNAQTGGCGSTTFTAPVTITAVPTQPVISYTGSPWCQTNTAAQSVAQTGTAGGTYTSSPTGLSISSSTGAITPSTSTAGTYTVTYTTPSAGCTALTATASVTITATPIQPVISYTGTPFCKTLTTAQSVTRTGTSGGTYTVSPTGLTISASTGAITPSLSTAGTYTVTYTTPSAGCIALSATASVIITTTPTVTISYTGTPFCSSAAPVSVTQTLGAGAYTGGTYTSAAGLTINASTGEITPSSSTAGTYTVTYTMAAAEGCALTTKTTSVTITATPIQPVISYTGSPFCKTLTTAQSVTITGTTGGTYTASPTGLTINASTGAITPSSSTVGTYTVTYTSTGACGSVSAIASVIITTTPTVTLAYTGNPFCSSVSTVSVTQTSGAGAYTGGTYTVSPVGLTINSSSGQITPSSSTAGAYTVTYTIPAGSGCATVSKTASVTITALPAAAITYTGSPVCNTLTTASVTRTGNSGGTYTVSPSSLQIASNTGVINPSTSSAGGTYTVTYTLASAGGCSAVSTTTSVIITTPPIAPTISYSGSPWCASSTAVQSVNQTGTAGGTYTSTAGLSINSTTGALTPSTSTAGTYTVTYTTPSAGCTALSTTTTVIISESPAQPTLACYQTAVFNTTSCVWDVTGTQESNTTTISASGSYTWTNNGQTYTSSGTYSGNEVNCVAQVLILTINSATIRMDMEWVSSTTNTADFQVRITNTGTVPFKFNSVIVRGVHAASLSTGTVSWVALNNNTIPEWLGWPNVTINLPYTAGTRQLNYSSNGTFFTAGTAPTIPIPAGTGIIIGTFRVSTTTTWVPNSDFSFVWAGSAAVVGYINGASYVSSLGQTGSATTCIGCLTVTASSAQPLNPPTPTASILSGNATICSGSSTNLSVAVTGGTSPYTVTVTDGTNNFTATGASPLSIPVSPTSTSTYSIVSVIGGGTGTGNTGSATVTVNSCSSNSTLNITMFIQGFYAGNNTMTPVLANQAQGTSSTIVDTVLVQLIDPTSLLVVATAQGVLQTDGTAACTFSTAQSGSFYIAVKHRNALETWSADPVLIGASSSYNFTTESNKAFGNNMIEVESGVWAFYSGDINQDGFIEGSDFPLLFNSNDAFEEGYLITDLNGDGFVEGSDYPILFNNSDNFIESMHPY